MKVLPNKITGGWITAKCDNTVRYKIRDLNARHQNWITGESMDSEYDINVIAASYILARVALVELEGLQNEDGSDYKLDMVKVNLAGRKESVVTHDCLERIPPELINEIAAAAADALSGITAKEKHEVNFTLDSSGESETSAETVTVTNPSANSDA